MTIYDENRLNFLNYYGKDKVKNFQKDYNLFVDGIFGSKTSVILRSEVVYIQRQIGCLLLDGIVGKETISKTKEFQKRYGLVVDGIARKKYKK